MACVALRTDPLNAFWHNVVDACIEYVLDFHYYYLEYLFFRSGEPQSDHCHSSYIDVLSILYLQLLLSMIEVFHLLVAVENRLYPPFLFII